MIEIESISVLLSAATPLAAILVTVWVSTRATRSQKRFDRESELMSKIREECANYVALTLDLGREAKKLTTSEERIKFFESAAYEKVRYSYQYIMMFCTDPKIIDAVKSFSALDDARFKVISAAIEAEEAPMTEASKFYAAYNEADGLFQKNRNRFYDDVRGRFEFHTKD